ncbi:MAG: NUDIX hydrolase [Rhizobiaceae bacterium]
MAFDLPRERVFSVSDVDVRLLDEPSPFEHVNKDAIARNWEAETAANPALFDGEVVLLSALAYTDGRLVGRCHAVRYSTFLFWRRNRAFSSSEHCFAHAMLVSADGALIAVRMGSHTVNAGRVYFAAGSFEPGDFSDGQVDLHYNMRREVAEETGLDISAADCAPSYVAYSAQTGTAIFRRYDLPENADDIAERIRAFVAAEADPEITEPVIIRNAHDLPDGLLPHMRAIVDWHFGAGRPGS